MAKAIVDRDFLLDVIIRNAGGNVATATYDLEKGELDVPGVRKSTLDAAIAAYDDAAEKAKLQNRPTRDSARTKLKTAAGLTDAEIEALGL